MDEYYICECGVANFLWFGTFVRCGACYNEYKHTGPKGRREYWLRRFNLETHEYHNWEHISSNAFKEPDSNPQIEET